MSVKMFEPCLLMDCTVLSCVCVCMYWNRPLDEQETESMVYSENKTVVQFALERLGLKKPTQLEEVAREITLKKPKATAESGSS